MFGVASGYVVVPQASRRHFFFIYKSHKKARGLAYKDVARGYAQRIHFPLFIP